MGKTKIGKDKNKVKKNVNQKSLREKNETIMCIQQQQHKTRQDMLDMFFSFHSCRCHFSYKFFSSVYGILWNFISFALFLEFVCNNIRER